MADSGSRRLFCFGLGYTALALAGDLLRDGWRVAGTCRDPADMADLTARGITAFLFAPGRPLPDLTAALAGTTHLLSCVPPDGAGDPVLAAFGGAIAAPASAASISSAAALSSTAAPAAASAPGGARLQWAGYLSTTGVYGDRGGGWVDEGSALRPAGARGRRRLGAERAWLRLWQESAVPIHIFRLAGIYGPGRSALDQVRAGAARRIVKPGQVFSRIHVADIVQVLRASMARPDPGAVYNVCDDAPAPPDAVIAFACEILGLVPPPEVAFEDADLSEMARSFYDDNKRVRNDRIKRELGVTLRYPDYRAGLRALLGEGT